MSRLKKSEGWGGFASVGHLALLVALVVALAALWPALSVAQPADGADAADEGGGGGDGFDPEAVAPPAELATLGVAEPADDQARARRAMPYQQVLERVEPAELPEPNNAGDTDEPDADADAVALLIEQAEQAVSRGDLFGAIRQLREAEAMAPNHHTVLRQLGIAYSLSGNRVRGASYLEQALAQQRDDPVALMLLCRHTALRGELAKTLAYADRLEQAPDQAERHALLAGYFRYQALEQAGYTRAAAEVLARVLPGVRALPAELADDALDGLVLRELRVLRTLQPNLTIALGDLYLGLNDTEEAAEQYAVVDLSQVTHSQPLLARRVYLALKSGEVGRAVELTVGSLSDSAAGEDRLIDYLVEQGVERRRIAASIEQAIDQQGTSLALLRGLAAVADRPQVLAAAQRWLETQPVRPEAYGDVAGLVRFDDDDPADAEPLAGLLGTVADQMKRDPEQAQAYAEAVTGEVDALVCLLRAMRHDAYRQRLEAADDSDAATAHLLAAIGYERAGRATDAIRHYRQARQRDASMKDRVLLPIARLLLETDQAPAAAEVLERVERLAGWQEIELAIRITAATLGTDEAIKMLDEWRQANGQTTDAALLRIELTAQSGSPTRACGELLRMINASPENLRLYEAGLDLVDRHEDRFNNLNEARNFRSAFSNQLRTNLPDSVPGRIERALNSGAVESAIEMLDEVVREAPDQARAWMLLAYLLEDADEPDRADQAFERFLATRPPGADRLLLGAERAVTNGQMQRASTLLRRLLALDREGVLPGPELTGDQASTALNLLASAEPEADLEPLSLKMVRRFPNSAKLNNALGYQWAVAGKNLLQAEAMIQRALSEGGQSFEVVDSLAWVQYKLGRFDEAAKTQTRAIGMLREFQRRSNRAAPGSMAVLSDHMGDILYRKGEVADAIRHWQIARAQRLDPQSLMLDPELRTLSARVDAKIDAVRDEKDPPVEPVPGPEAHGPEGHPADRDNPPNDQNDPEADPAPQPPPDGPQDADANRPAGP